MFKVGIITHYYEKTGIAVAKLDGTLSVNDKIKFVLNGNDLFSQEVVTLQIDYKKVDSGSRGSVVLLKTNEKVSQGTEIFKIG